MKKKKNALSGKSPSRCLSKGDPFIECSNLVKIYQVGDIEVFALQGLDVTIRKEEIVALIGASGSGKSTLLNVLGGLDKPTGGKALVGSMNLGKFTSREARLYKRRFVGFVWQNVSRNLVPYLTALENVELPMVLGGRLDREWAIELMEAVGLKDRMNHKPSELSGGQQQRVAIAIAMANKPELLLADEPTGSLDLKTGDIILDVFNRVRDLYKITLLIVTHDMRLAKSVDRFLLIRDGKISTEQVRRKPRDGEVLQEHDEFVILDSAGRLQLPPDYVDELPIRNRVKMHREEKRIIITPGEE